MIKSSHQDTNDVGALTSEADQPKPGDEKQERPREAEPERSAVPEKDSKRQRGRSRDDRPAKEASQPHASRER